MRIGIDVRELLGRPTGVGRYLAELLRRWANESHEFVLFTPEALDAAAAGGSLPPERFPVRRVPGGRGTWWEQVRLGPAVAREGLDVFFAPAYTAPLAARTPFVVTVHDASFAAHPEWFAWREGLRRRHLTAWSARRAAAVIAVSEFSKREIAARLGVAPARIQVVRQGVEVRTISGSGPAAREPLVIFVGSILNRRHVPDLIEAFAVVSRSHADARLVVAGENRTFPRQDLASTVRRLGLERSVSIEDYVSEARLQDLYRRASVFGFLSEYEGFGLTPLEALAAGIPTVLADTPHNHEVFEDAAVYVNPRDTAGIAAALSRLLTDADARSACLASVPRLLPRYRWDRAARETLDILLAAARPNGRRP
jgi:glycosyltransferase involved in cell wall biosynthesis